MKMKKNTALALVILSLSNCASLHQQGYDKKSGSTYYPGPDKQFEASAQGALTGAGTGAITGFQVSSATGPGAFIGAGIGALAGGFQGSADDASEERINRLSKKIEASAGSSFAQRVLEEHYTERARLSPQRDIYPADMFFNDDSSKLSREGNAVVTEIARIRKELMPWSRLQVLVYVQSKDPESVYALGIAKSRAAAITNALIRSGIEPRRIEPKAALVASPVIDDPDDTPDRYSQAVEFINADT